MFTIYMGVQPLHHPNLDSKGYVCISPVLKEKLNTHGSLEFSMAPQHPLYESIKKRLSYIFVYDDGEEIWRGRVISVSLGWDNRKIVYCEGELSYLADTTVRPFAFSGTVEAFLQKLVTNHNSQMGNSDARRFAAGTVTVSGNVNITVSSPQTTWESISTNLLKVFDGYIRTRKSGSTVYIDYLVDFTEDSGQDIVFGENLIDLTEQMDAANVLSRVIPYGAKKNTAPVLFKRRSSNSRYFDRYTGDVVAGDYLIVSNGAAMNSTRTGRRLSSEIVTITNDVINLPNTTAMNKCIWAIAESTVKFKEDVAASGTLSEKISLKVADSATYGGYVEVGSGTRNLTIGGGSSANIEIGDDGTASSGSVALNSSAGQGGSANGIPIYAANDPTTIIGYSDTINVDMSSTSAGALTLTGTSKNANEWTIRNSDGYLYAPEGESSGSFTPSDVNWVWKISNGENGATITNKVNSEKKFPATLHGDVDNGFACFWNASGDSNGPSASQEWDGNRVTVKRARTIQETDTSAPDVHTNGSDIVRNEAAMELWGRSSIVGYKVFDEAQTPDELLDLAVAWLAKQVAESITIDVSAADLSLIGASSYRLRIGVYAQVISSLHNIALRLLCIQKTTYFSEPSRTSTVYGAGKKTITDLQGGLIQIERSA